MKLTWVLLAVFVSLVSAHQQPLSEEKPTWMSKYGAQRDQPFSGPLSFAHLPYDRCLENEDAIPITPFDNALAVDQMEVAYSTLLDRKPVGGFGENDVTRALSKDGLGHPRVIRSVILEFAS
ncbi:hypothetical protein H0H81_012241 [Sphagnurus paluster]|uniref:Uncharacterized protein n=1 Tax=Sphagnurus paluster TaxID=117069 RepID=A0A9P7K842_9AGAR|nr:hypothetical protein H0H81_012241 [Sphagnurus paluster]